jgi:hypothetical protein
VYVAKIEYNNSSMLPENKSIIRNQNLELQKNLSLQNKDKDKHGGHGFLAV